MERREGVQHPYIDLEGPETIEAGMNFYDQPPFDRIISSIEQQTSVPSDSIRRMVTSLIATRMSPIITKKDVAQVYQNIKIQINGRTPSDLKKQFRITGDIPREDILRAAASFLIQGKRFPHFFEYLSTKFDRGIFNFDGEPNPQNKIKYKPVLTYPAWLQAKVEREKRMKASEITVVTMEAFPQQFGIKDIHGITRESGAGRVNRRWRILQATTNTPHR